MPTTFKDRMEAIVEPEIRGNLRGFAEKSGFSPSYLSQILTKGTLPTVTKLADALRKAGVPEPLAESALVALSIEKARASPDSAPAVEALLKRLDVAGQALTDLVAVLNKHGVNIPQTLLKNIDSLRD